MCGAGGEAGGGQRQGERAQGREGMLGARGTTRGHRGGRVGDQRHGKGPRGVGAGRRAGRQPFSVGVRGWPLLRPAAPCYMLEATTVLEGRPGLPKV